MISSTSSLGNLSFLDLLSSCVLRRSIFFLLRFYLERRTQKRPSHLVGSSSVHMLLNSAHSISQVYIHLNVYTDRSARVRKTDVYTELFSVCTSLPLFQDFFDAPYQRAQIGRWRERKDSICTDRYVLVPGIFSREGSALQALSRRRRYRERKERHETERDGERETEKVGEEHQKKKKVRWNAASSGPFLH